MTVEAILIVLLVGAIAGWLAGLIMKGAGFGLVGNIIVGVVGAFVAAWLLPQLGIAFSLGNPLITSIVYATIGAVVVLFLLSLIRRGRA
ncbi:MAG: GlsB/YeaQ/YmgE family stress response membrane protein [Hyphomonadaceae bacterium]|nr:GlsB/YeaQ/YmgE family stress response membrane protein [Hyphomonadaceae bacterium]